MFLWVVLAVRNVVRGIDAEDGLEQLKERLETLPTRLVGLYIHILNEIHKRSSFTLEVRPSGEFKDSS